MRQKKRADGRYQRQVVFGRDTTGAPIRKTVYGRTIRQLNENVLRKQEEWKLAHPTGATLLVSQWMEMWLDAYKADVAVNTRSMYKRISRIYILPLIGDLFVQDVTMLHIRQLLNMPRLKKSAATALKVYDALNQLFEVARKSRYISENPVRDIDRPKHESPVKRALTDKEIRQIGSASFTLKQKTFIRFLLHTGVRRGEAMAMSRENVNLEKGEIYVRKGVVCEEGKVVIHSPKTAAGNRTVPIVDELRVVLEEYMQMLEGDIIFPSPEGEIMTYSDFQTFWRNILGAIRAAGATAKDITPHIFRHTFTSQLVQKGVSIKDAQYSLGHSSAQMTMDVYAHFDPQATENVRVRLNS